MGKANEEEEKRKKEGEEGTRVGWVKGKKCGKKGGEEKKRPCQDSNLESPDP